jgi:hypothetical protein
MGRLLWRLADVNVNVVKGLKRTNKIAILEEVDI